MGIAMRCQTISGELKPQAPLGYQDIDDCVQIGVWCEGQTPRKLITYSLLYFAL